jgi:hypothetical protein
VKREIRFQVRINVMRIRKEKISKLLYLPGGSSPDQL